MKSRDSMTFKICMAQAKDVPHLAELSGQVATPGQGAFRIFPSVS